MVRGPNIINTTIKPTNGPPVNRIKPPCYDTHHNMAKRHPKISKKKKEKGKIKERKMKYKVNRNGKRTNKIK